MGFQVNFLTKQKKNILRSVSMIATVAFLTGCGAAKNQMTFDRSGELTREDYRRAMAPRPVEQVPEADIPELQTVVNTPEELRETMPLVSVSVNQTVALRDLLYELAEQAKMDIELDPQIQGSLIFTARNRPLDEVIGRICKMAGLRYQYKEGVLRIEVDRPYLQTYQIDYLNIIRNVESSITSSNEVDSSEGGADIGSEMSVESEVESDFWAELETNVEQILTSSDNQTTLATSSTPRTTTRNFGPATTGPDGETLPPPPLPEPILDVKFPVGGSEALEPNPPATYSVNRAGGLITIYANAAQQRLVYKYLEDLQKIATSQVMIEAKILEVALTDDYASGIEWEKLDLTGLVDLDMSFSSPGITPSAAETFTASLSSGSDIGAVVNAISRFGAVRSLSNPRLTVINQQPAVLSVVENQVFFEVETEITPVEGALPIITQDVTIRTVPEGVMINVLPSVNTHTNEIMLSVRPSVSRRIDSVADPVNAGNLIPRMSIKEMDSILRMQSGEVIVMGGLMEDRSEATETGAPVISDVPILGNLFKNHTDDIEKNELVIFMRATIIPGSNVHTTDRELYNTFAQDPRPFSM